MLNQLSMWQMVIDLSLVTSILVMAFRYAKSSKVQTLIPRIVELEGRVRNLLDETEERARQISEQLIRREQNISKNLSDIEKRQREFDLSLTDSDAMTKELSLMCESARREAAELERIVVEARSSVRTPTKSTHEEALEFIPAPRARYSDQARAPRAQSEKSVDQAQARTKQSEPATASVRTLQDSYRLAEQMLKEGRNTEEVSERTKLSLDGIERLAQMIEIEREERTEDRSRYATPRAAADPRLGALGMSRR
jgi:hypothetical protein